jgi:ABC-2 type transport system ATP-binding protein
MLKFQNITKTFKTDLIGQPFVALKDVSFEIPTGSMVGFLGANGSGKTTSLKIIMDFIRADQGTVEFSKELGSTRVEILKNIGFLPERPYFYPNLTGNEFLNFMGRLSEVEPHVIKQQLDKWLPRFKIDHAVNRQLKTYSKGMLQRIGFLATILHNPEFIILDEPLSGLDPIGRKELKDVIVEVFREGKTVFFSSHIVPDIEEICDRVIFLKEGQLVYDGEVAPLLKPSGTLEYVIKYRNPSDMPITSTIQNVTRFPQSLHIGTIRNEDKNLVLSELLQKNIEIVGMDVIKPSLEEIFYHIKMK